MFFFNPSLGAPGRSTVVAMQDLGSGGSDHHAVATVFEIDTAGQRGKELVMFKDVLICMYIYNHIYVCVCILYIYVYTYNS